MPIAGTVGVSRILGSPRNGSEFRESLDHNISEPGKHGGQIAAHGWAHARRQFFETVQLNPRDSVATPIVGRMDELFSVDADARRRALSVAARHVPRQETLRTLLDDIRSKIEAVMSVALPSSSAMTTALDGQTARRRPEQ